MVFQNQQPTTKRNAAKFLAIYFAILFCSATLALWIFIPDALSLLTLAKTGFSSGVMSYLLSLILQKPNNIEIGEAAREEFIERAQAKAGRPYHWSRSPVLWVGGATLVLFCFLRFVWIG